MKETLRKGLSLGIVMTMMLTLWVAPITEVYAWTPTSQSSLIEDFVQPSWDIILNRQQFDYAYTSNESKSRNGTPNANHFVQQGTTLRFFGYDGYDNIPYTDMCYATEKIYPDGFNEITFSFSPQFMSFHSVLETGFLFNGYFSDDKKYITYTGYAITMVQTNSLNGSSRAKMSLWYMKNSPLYENTDSQAFPGGINNVINMTGRYLLAQETILSPAGSEIKQGDTRIYTLQIAKTAGSFSITIDGNTIFPEADLATHYTALTGIVPIKPDLAIPVQTYAGAGFGGFGFFAGNSVYGHSCHVLSVTEYVIDPHNTDIPGSTIQTSATVKFVDESGNPLTGVLTDLGTAIKDNPSLGVEWHDQHSVTHNAVYAKGQYSITLLSDIATADNKLYIFDYAESSGDGIISTLDDLNRLSYYEKPDDNIITLHYKLSPLTVGDFFATKNAYVNGGSLAWGTAERPVKVKKGDIITYEIAITNAGDDLISTAAGTNKTSLRVEDTLPSGLSLVAGSVTVLGDDKATPLTLDTDYWITGSGQNLICSFQKIPKGNIFLQFDATVDAYGTFDNSAYLIDDNKPYNHSGNHTYHMAEPYMTVFFRDLNNPGGADIIPPITGFVADLAPNGTLAIWLLQAVDSSTCIYMGDYSVGNPAPTSPMQNTGSASSPPRGLDITKDTTLYLYYNRIPGIFVDYIETGRNVPLKQREYLYIPFNNNFSPMSESAINDAVLNGLKPTETLTEKAYDYVGYSWDIDSAATLDSPPRNLSNITEVRTLTLYFAPALDYVVFLMDTTNSMAGNPMAQAKAEAVRLFTNELVVDLPPAAVGGSTGEGGIGDYKMGYNTAVITYSSDIEAIIPTKDAIAPLGFTSDIDQITNAINGIAISTGGGTNTWAGLQAAEDLLDELPDNVDPDLDKRIILVTDGLPNLPISASLQMPYDTSQYMFWRAANETYAKAKALKDKGYIIETIAFLHGTAEQTDFARKFLYDISGSTRGFSDAAAPLDGGNYYELSNPEDLRIIFDVLSQKILSPQPSPVYQHVTVACPVDITVSYNNSHITSDMTRGGFINTAPWGRIDYSGPDADIKTVSLYRDEPFEIQLTGSGTGTMDYTVVFYDGYGNLLQSDSFEDVRITENTRIVTSTDRRTPITLLYDEYGDGNTVPLEANKHYPEPEPESEPESLPEPEPESKPESVPEPEPESEPESLPPPEPEPLPEPNLAYEAAIDPTTKTFSTARTGYHNADMAQTFTIKNIGTERLTNLAASLPAAEFGIAGFEISSDLPSDMLDPGDTMTVRVWPVNGLEEDTYIDVLVITGDNGIDLNVPLRFTVSDDPVYMAAIDPTDKTFAPAQAGYSHAGMSQIFTIENIGTELLTGLSASLETEDFEIAEGLPATTVTSGSALAISVRPANDLPAKDEPYEDTLTVTGDNDIRLTVPLSFTVSLSPTYTAVVDPVDKTFPAAQAGYNNAAMAQIFTLRNTGTGVLTGLTAFINDSDNGISFEISTPLSGSSVGAGGSVTVSVRPVNGLLASDVDYTDNLIITGDNGVHLTVPLRFTVSTKQPHIVYGDMNGDGVADIADLVLMLRYFSHPGVAVDLASTDVNGDAVIDLADLILFLRYFAQPNVALGPSEEGALP